MSPHRILHDNRETSPLMPDMEDTRQTNGGSSSRDYKRKSLLQRFDDDDLHDMICVGFGPASLAIAIALHDALETGVPTLSTKMPKVRFMERQSRFAWHAGMLLPGTKMQITFIKDLATLRNPRSEFTFLNYLHRKDRLVPFTNLGTFLPQRIEYEDYMRWCAGHFEDVVDYSQDVESVDAGKTNAETGAVEFFNVNSWDRRTGRYVIKRARNVVIAVGGKPNMPTCLEAEHPRVIHSSQYATSISDIFPAGSQPKSIAVVGAGQSAAEVFHNIPSRFPGAKAYLLIKGSALRPSDDSPFVNEVFDPDRVNDVYSQDSETRAEGIVLDKGTNYGVVRLELLEEIYSTLYSYRIRYKSEDDWPQQILPHRSVTGMSDVQLNGEPVVRLHIQDQSGKHHANRESRNEVLDVDLVVVAAGYRRHAHEGILAGLRHLMPSTDATSNRWEVSRDYSVKFEEGSVHSGASVWLQGCNEATHGLSDTLLSILASRGGEMVQNIFGSSTQRAVNRSVKAMHATDTRS